MNTVLILLIILLMLLLLCFTTSLNILLTPQLIFIASFIPGLVYLIGYVKVWEVNLSFTTMLVMILGTSLFVITSIVVNAIFNNGKIYLHGIPCCLRYYENAYIRINVDKWKIYCCICIQILTLLLLFRYLKSLSNTGLGAAIYLYRYANTFTENKFRLPSIVANLRILSMSMVYFWSYILAKNILYKEENEDKVLYIISIVLGMIISMLLGSRTEMVYMIMAFGVQYYFLWGEKYVWTRNMKLKTLFWVVTLAIALLGSFQKLGDFLGRNSTSEFWYYIAKYLSAEVKNLDIFIREGNYGADLYQCQTLINLINWISGKFGFPDWSHELDIPFRYINGKGLGNVCTIFYAFYYDAGIAGVVLFSILMAVIAQVIYQKVLYPSDRGIKLYLISYSFILPTLAFSFFSNKFYEDVFSIKFVKYLICWNLLKKLVQNVSVKGLQ